MGGRACRYLSVRRSCPPQFNEGGHGTTERYANLGGDPVTKIARRAGGALRVPRPAHVLQNPPAATAVRAELEERLEKLALPKDRPVKIWVADESRFGVHTQSRRCWALRGGGW